MAAHHKPKIDEATERRILDADRTRYVRMESVRELLRRFGIPYSVLERLRKKHGVAT